MVDILQGCTFNSDRQSKYGKRWYYCVCSNIAATNTVYSRSISNDMLCTQKKLMYFHLKEIPIDPALRQSILFRDPAEYLLRVTAVTLI